MTHLLRVLLLSVAVLFTASGCGGGMQPIHVNTKSVQGVAIRGYDPVAYFTRGKPVKGDRTHSAQWQGATWLFSTEEHKQLFVGDPEKYAPQYGGWCAFAMARGKKVDIDPNAWKIVDGKLYLNYSQPTQKFWEKQMQQDIELADENWKKLGPTKETKLPE